MNAKDTQPQLSRVQSQPAQTPKSPHFDSQTRLLVFMLVLMVAPKLLNASHHEDMYQNVPNWYTSWALLNDVVPVAFLLAMLFARKRAVNLAGLAILVVISIIDIFLEITILKPVLPIFVYASRLAIIFVLIMALRVSWRDFN